MNNIILLSPLPGAGVNTIAVNLGIGLTHCAYKVCLLSGYARLSDWLSSPGNKPGSLLERNPEFSWHKPSEEYSFQKVLFNYQLYVPETRDLLTEFVGKYTTLILCVIDDNQANLPEILAINQYVRSIRQDTRGVDLVIPNKIKPGEWSDNSQLIFELAEDLGWEKVADPIPYCEALHDLPKENQSVWDLPAQYKNRQAAFRSLVDRVLEMI